ncbi:hypothetical protein B0T17DRAFT_256922 [Bombardia bombarda]|uniref:Uncharacterized protein n=1 Tax=Bombardia bombarda TaxID=252184 RepID=A0AA39X0J5_9PEZI|nr:hypothetical protein B0T17DRAFT_256922 [Bombardia bombarda]
MPCRSSVSILSGRKNALLSYSPPSRSPSSSGGSRRPTRISYTYLVSSSVMSHSLSHFILNSSTAIPEGGSNAANLSQKKVSTCKRRRPSVGMSSASDASAVSSESRDDSSCCVSTEMTRPRTTPSTIRHAPSVDTSEPPVMVTCCGIELVVVSDSSPSIDEWKVVQSGTHDGAPSPIPLHDDRINSSESVFCSRNTVHWWNTCATDAL